MQTPKSSDAATSLDPVKVTWWHAGGLHAHITYPDGSWLRRTWKANEYWEIDVLRLDLEREYGRTNVQVSP